MNVDVSVLTGKHRPYLYVLVHLIGNRPKLWFQFIVQLWYFILYKLHIYNERNYQEKRWSILKKIDLEKTEKSFKKKRFNHHIVFGNDTTVIDQYPNIILQALTDKYEVSGFELDASKNIKYKTLASRIEWNKETILSPFTARHNSLPDNFQIYFNRHFYHSYKNYLFSEFGLIIRDLGILAIASVIFAGAIVVLAVYGYQTKAGLSVLIDFPLVFFNTLPIFLLMCIFYAIFNSLAWSAALSGFTFFILGLVNYFMLQYRSFPFKFTDIFLSSEAMNMGHRYSYVPPKFALLLLIGLLIFVVSVHFICKPAMQSIIKSISILVIAILVGVKSFNKYYANQDYYGSVTQVKYGSRWNETDVYMSRGFIYSFVNSTVGNKIQQPVGYSTAKAEKILNKYKYQTLPKNKRINVVLIQLEAFQDFSKYKNLDIDSRVYAGLNKVRAQSMHGELTTTIFGGGTVDTERKSITGYSTLPPEFNENTSSFVRYFNANNYYTLALHPGFGWFYNRQNVDKYLGFDKFLDKENYYNNHVSKAEIVKDKLVFNNFSKQFDHYTKNNQNLFTQLVTYQNHGPYPTTYNGQTWLPYKKGYNKSDYAIINNYLNGVKQTSDQLYNLVNTFNKKKEPVVIAFWGDHNPWGGNNNSTYNMLGIDLDQSKQSGFNNYYNTPYDIWANDSAKKKLKDDFVGEGPQISPMYILPTIFEHMGVKGSSYMQLLEQLQKDVPVFGLNNRYIYDNNLVSKLPKKVQKEVDDYKIVEYYRQTHLVND